MPAILDTTGGGILDTTGNPVLDTLPYGPVPPALLLVPPGISSPMAFARHAWPSRAPVLVTAADSGTGADSATGGPAVPGGDAGGGTDTGSVAPPPVTGAGTVQQLNPVRETVTGLDVSLRMASALGAVLQFANHGSERLYVRSSDPGVTLTVLTGGMVLDQAAQPFPAVALAPGALYCFGPFHTVVQVPGTNQVQVALSTAFGVQALVVQGPDAH